jgi:ribosomal protein L11 methyltransferase
MAWQRLSLVVPGPDAAALGEALQARGAISTDLSDADAGTAAEREVLIEADEQTALWSRCRVSALFGTARSRRRARGKWRESGGGRFPRPA